MVWLVMGGSRGGTGGPDPLEKSQVAICFLRNTGTVLPREAVEGGPYGHL